MCISEIRRVPTLLDNGTEVIDLVFLYELEEGEAFPKSPDEVEDVFGMSADEVVNQLHWQARFHYARDLREKPYTLLRMRIDESPAPTFS